MVKIMENPIKMDDLGVPLFLETPIYRASGRSVRAQIDSQFLAKHIYCFLVEFMANVMAYNLRKAFRRSSIPYPNTETNSKNT